MILRKSLEMSSIYLSLKNLFGSQLLESVCHGLRRYTIFRTGICNHYLTPLLYWQIYFSWLWNTFLVSLYDESIKTSECFSCCIRKSNQKMVTWTCVYLVLCLGSENSMESVSKTLLTHLTLISRLYLPCNSFLELVLGFSKPGKL